MSYRDDDAAGLARADALQHELDRSHAELKILRARLSGPPTHDSLIARDAELADLRARLAASPHPQVPPKYAESSDPGLIAFVFMIVSMLAVVIIVAAYSHNN